MSRLTEFQDSCERRLRRALASINTELDERRLGGKREVFIAASIRGTKVALWIYEDEAMYKGDGLDRRFEVPDYDSSEELIDAFISTLIQDLRRLQLVLRR